MENLETIILFWLLPSNAPHNDVEIPISSLRTIFNEVRIYDDSDQCIDWLTSFQNQTIFLVLGPGRSNLVPILSPIDELCYIYLSEPHHSSSTTKVRGVFSDPQGLFHQLTKDAKIIEDSYARLQISSIGESLRNETSTKDVKRNSQAYMCSKLLLDTLIDSPRPAENIHDELIKESYRIYEKNETMKKSIEEFIHRYDPSEAIQWYTKDAFIYRLINMALRTDNILIIFKFRFIIQDIYKQLTNLHEKQRKILTENQQASVLKFYRGQRISSTEMSNLQHAVGSMISISSFVSMTKNPEVANIFSGNGDARPNFESVIFEVFINEFDLGNEVSPYADISHLSAMPHEEEVLLCMSTVMHLESVETRGYITYIRLRVCRYDNSVLTQMKIWLSRFNMLDLDNVQMSIFKLGWALQSMLDFERAEKMYNILDLNNNPSGHITLALWSFMAKELLRVGIGDDCARLTFVKQLLPIFNLLPLPDSLRDLMRRFEQIINLMMNGQPQTFNEILLLRREQLHLMEMLIQLTSELGLPPLPMVTFVKAQIDLLKSMLDDVSEPNNSVQIHSVLNTNQHAVVEQDHNQTISHLRELLSLHCTPDNYVAYNKQLIQIYEKKNDWSSVIECCQAIINRTELAPNSFEIVQAHLKCGEMFLNLQDISMALLSYMNALEVQHQHHPIDHPLTCKVHIKMGKLFEKLGDTKTALENYQKASTCHQLNIAIDAYNQIGHIYLGVRNYELARSNYMKALTNLERQIPRIEPLLALEHGYLAVVEHKTGNYLQRDFYVNRAFTLSANNGEARQAVENLIRKFSKKKN